MLAIGSLIDIGGAHTQMVINYVIVPNLITMLSHKEAKVQNAASKAINSVIASIKDQAQVVLERDTLSHFRGVWPRHRSQMPYDFRVIVIANNHIYQYDIDLDFLLKIPLFVVACIKNVHA